MNKKKPKPFLPTRLATCGLALLAFNGCLSISEEEKLAHTAPVGVVPEITMAATAWRLAHGAWPQTKEELEEGFRQGSAPGKYLSYTERVLMVEQTDEHAVFRCLFPDGSTSEVRINLN